MTNHLGNECPVLVVVLSLRPWVVWPVGGGSCWRRLLAVLPDSWERPPPIWGLGWRVFVAHELVLPP